MSSLTERFAAAVRRGADLHALVSETSRVSRLRLAQDSDALALALVGDLRARSATPIVAFHLEKNHDALTFIVACLKARVTFVPINMAWPPAHARRVLELAKPSLVITETPGETHAGFETRSLASLRDGGGEHLEPFIDNALAYVIFTSGSTGDPKGVPISVAALDEFARNIESFVPLADDGEVLANLAELSFDQSVQDWVYALLGKGPLHILPSTINSLDLVEYVAAHKLTYVSSVANTFAMMMMYRKRFDAAKLASLRFLCAGGSTLFADTARQVREVIPQARLFNLFGPTEATVYCSGHEVVSEASLERTSVQVGTPFPGQQFLFDKNGTIVEWPGDEAELLILGTQLMAGYVGRSSGLETITWQGRSLTAYRSGDLFTGDANGLYFVSRMSGFIKSRGYRISPIAVEGVYVDHPDIIECGAVGIPDQVLENRLVMFYTANSDLDEDALDAFGRAKLPPYSLPDEFIRLPALPKSSAGKLDYHTLRKIYAERS